MTCGVIEVRPLPEGGWEMVQCQEEAVWFITESGFTMSPHCAKHPPRAPDMRPMTGLDWDRLNRLMPPSPPADTTIEPPAS